MVAITADSPRYTHRQYASLGAHQAVPAPVRLAPPAGPLDALSPVGRLMVVLAAVAVVVAVAVASAAFGRVLDTHRGIPEVGAAPSVTAQP